MEGETLATKDGTNPTHTHTHTSAPLQVGGRGGGHSTEPPPRGGNSTTFTDCSLPCASIGNGWLILILSTAQHVFHEIQRSAPPSFSSQPRTPHTGSCEHLHQTNIQWVSVMPIQRTQGHSYTSHLNAACVSLSLFPWRPLTANVFKLPLRHTITVNIAFTGRDPCPSNFDASRVRGCPLQMSAQHALFLSDFFVFGNRHKIWPNVRKTSTGPLIMFPKLWYAPPSPSLIT